MSALTNGRFAEYATSGAFAIGLTRSQVASLSLILGVGGSVYMAGASLERKGLVEAISNGNAYNAGTEFRLTQAGALVLELCRLAGLTNVGTDAIGAEIDGLRHDLDEARAQSTDADARMRSMCSRMQEAEYELADARREIARLKREPSAEEEFPIRIRLRDPLPEKSVEELLSGSPA